MGSKTATPIVTGNPNKNPNMKIFTTTYTGSASYDTVKIPGGVTVKDGVFIQERATDAASGYVGLCEVFASRSAANGTIRVAPLSSAPTSNMAYAIVQIKA